jgi:hypothetical protein
MQAIGQSVTWVTRCFIDSGCGAHVFAHTNGHGDFVLFDELMPPWPVHGCYLRRFELLKRSNILRIAATRDFPAPFENVSALPRRFVPLELVANDRFAPFNIVATVVDVVETIIEWRRYLQKPIVYGKRADLMYNQAQTNRSVLRLYTGSGEECYTLVNLQRFPIKFVRPMTHRGAATRSFFRRCFSKVREIRCVPGSALRERNVGSLPRQTAMRVSRFIFRITAEGGGII